MHVISWQFIQECWEEEAWLLVTSSATPRWFLGGVEPKTSPGSTQRVGPQNTPLATSPDCAYLTVLVKHQRASIGPDLMPTPHGLSVTSRAASGAACVESFELIGV